MEPPTHRRAAGDGAQFDVLANAERRTALQVLSGMEQPVDLRALAITITARELEKPASRVDPEEIKHREIALYHNHLPRMEAYGIVRFDADENSVELRESPRATATVETIVGLESR